MNLTYVLGRRQCTSDELILDLDFKGAYSTALACIPAIDWEHLASLNAQRDQFFPKMIEIVDRHQDVEKLGYVPPIMGSIAFAFPSDCRHPCLPVRYATDLLFYPLRGSTCVTGIEMVQARTMGARVDLYDV
jgi:hypothetical protein